MASMRQFGREIKAGKTIQTIDTIYYYITANLQQYLPSYLSKTSACRDNQGEAVCFWWTIIQDTVTGSCVLADQTIPRGSPPRMRRVTPLSTLEEFFAYFFSGDLLGIALNYVGSFVH